VSIIPQEGNTVIVEWELNNRPRKRLNFKTPQEVFDYCLKRPKGLH